MGGITTTIGKVKYIGIASLTIAILSILILNIISSYSSSNIESNAIDSNSEVSTLAQATGPATISLSITSSSSSSTGGDDANLSLSIPQGGGIATGRHTVEVSSNSYAGWSISLTSKNGETDLVNNSDSKYTIPTLPSTATVDKATTLANNTYGVAFPYGDWLTKNYYNEEADYLSTDQAVLATTRWTSLASLTKAIGIAGSDAPTSDARPGTRNIYYGVMVDSPASFPAGDYSASVVYTATALLPPTPSNLAITPNQYEADGCSTPDVTITGTNLESAYSVYIDLNNNGKLDTNLTPADLGTGSASEGTISEQCTNLDLVSSGGQASLTCTMPRSSYIPTDQPSDVYIITQATEPGILADAYSYTEPATGLSVKSTSENIIVDYDENLIPVIYVGYDGNGGGHWESLTKSEIESNTDTWFNYTNKQWANAVTVTKDSLSKYQDKHATIDNDDVLGYWVYIPRYAYEVMRPNAVDRVVDDDMAEEKGGFNIHFETVNDPKKIPAESCNLGITTAAQMWANGSPTSSAGPTNTNILAKDYRTGCGIDRTYPGNDATKSNGGTTWATHPAFTWGDTELNGLWVGKFETTGKVNAPTAKPNQHANISEYIGEFSTMAKSIGKEDKCNVGGNAVSGITQNSHNLQTTKSHMLKNSEWGAVAYLSTSKYGAGVNGTKPNSAMPATSADADEFSPSSGYRYGITGCGPKSKTSESNYSSVTVNGETVNLPALSADHIEDPLACGDKAHAYNGEIGVLASTTNTIYGIYDMSGGAYEYVMGNLTGYDNQSETSSSTYMTTQAKPPYVDLYKESPYGNFTSGVRGGAANNPVGWGVGAYEYYWNNDVCTWPTCGGHALHETKQYQSVSGRDQSWGSDSSDFVRPSNSWFLRGGYADYGSNGLFHSTDSEGYSHSRRGFRSALLALPAGQ